MSPRIITISGASGSGKSYLVEKILQRFPFITEIAGITTRPKRENEVDGQSSHFITLEQFNQLENQNELILIKEFFGNKYAWLKSDLANGSNIRIMNVSYKSIKELKDSNIDMISIFIRPSSEEMLKEKLKARTKSEEEYEKRITDYYESELFLKNNPQLFDSVFVNSYDSSSFEPLLATMLEGFYLSENEEIIKFLQNEDPYQQNNLRAVWGLE